MQDRKRQTWEVVNPNGNCVVVTRTKNEALDEVHAVIMGLGSFAGPLSAGYSIRKGKPMSDYEMDMLPRWDWDA